MKKIYLFLAIAASISSLTAQQIYEPFSGTGALTSNGWVKHSGSGNSIQIITTASDNGNSLSYSGLANSSGNRISITDGDSEDVNKAFTTPLSSMVYYSLLVKVLNTTGLSVSGDFPIHLTEGSGTTSMTTFRAKVYFKVGGAPNTYNIGVENGNANTPTYLSTDFPVNQTVFIVVKRDILNNITNLWINPAIGSSEPASDITNTSGTQTASMKSICIRQNNGIAPAGTGNMEFDEIRISDNWTDVVPPFLEVNDVKVGKSLPILSNTLIGEQVSVLLEGTSKVEFYSINGSLVKSVIVRSKESINTQDLQKGIYVVKVTNNNRIETVKVVRK